MKSSISKAALLATLVLTAFAPASSASNAPLRVTFDKQVTDPATFAFAGTTGGDVAGGLVSQLVSLDGQTGPNLHIVFDWNVTAGAQSFVARTSGIWNTKTGSVVMNGTVIDGYLLGAQVHEVGQLVDPAKLRFQGSLQLMPGSAA